jgi:hypothetical protein
MDTTKKTGIENAEERGSERGKKMKKHGKAFQEEDTDDREKLERKRK